MINLNSIPKSESDLLLNKWGYDLMEEYFQLISSVNFLPNSFILDVATGTGRAASILSRMGYQILTGDYNPDMKTESEKRITKEYLNNIIFTQLNLEQIPFNDNAANNIVCINTLHELDNPLLCLDEIIRIHSGKGKLLIADFNAEGFDVMDKSHTIRYGKLHPRGKISSDELESILIINYSEIKEINTKLNKGFIVSGKRNEK
jgi:ubiquinone/menaquinone biosynthesis C-methylase UbiE